MTFTAVVSSTQAGYAPRNSIGGAAWMPHDSEVPKCKCCQTSMQLFVQFDIDSRFGDPIAEGGHFVLFMCPQCNEIPCFENFNGKTLPENYWDETEGNYFAAIFPRDVSDTLVSDENRLQVFDLKFVDDVSTVKYQPTIRVGGSPNWIQGEEKFNCSCGGEMKHLMQISEFFPFPKLSDARGQSDSFSKNDYCLFLGNEVYVLACEKVCNERSVWITVQN